MTQPIIKLARSLLLPDAPVLVQNGPGILCLTREGEIQTLNRDQARALIKAEAPLVCHAPQIARMLELDRITAYDVMELFAFVHPARFCVPTPKGLAQALFLLEPQNAEDELSGLRAIARHLLSDLSESDSKTAAAIAAMMGMEQHTGWGWTASVLHALDRANNPPDKSEIRAALKIADTLPEWSTHAPEPAAGHMPVTGDESAERLQNILQKQSRQPRPGQEDYARKLSAAFTPTTEAGAPRLAMAEAGTGLGKTLGYLAPAMLWAEKNAGPVWISTYTRNLQRQIDSELDRLYDDATTKLRKVVTRKGRENYLCLLNLDDAAQSAAVQNNEAHAVALGLMLRWVEKTQDGDLTGKDFPGWLTGLLGWNRVWSLSDRRGECIYSACPHFNRCFVEKSIRKSKRADIVIANHALVMHQTAISNGQDALPGRYVFDEGHHIFDAADSTFASHLNGQETADLRRWILGQEGGQKSRARGLKRRIEDLIANDEDAARALDDILDAARSLPGPEWKQRIADGAPKGVTEQFLFLCRQQVYARTTDAASNYAIETDVMPPIEGLFEAGYALRLRLMDLRRPMLQLATRLQKNLEDQSADLNTDTRERLRYVMQNLQRKADHELGGWIAMLDSLSGKDVANSNGTVDWLEVSRSPGPAGAPARDDDVGFYRHSLDPAISFAQSLKPHAQGVAFTSATLRDVSEEDPDGWNSALKRAGITALNPAAEPDVAQSFDSPFDYKAQTRILVVGDVDKDNTGEVAAAFAALFKASGGGALGIFTAIQRLRAVHDPMKRKLAKDNIALYAQHMDALEMPTLIDIFRAEEDSCLIGTDATRDGIDVPGRSLRLVVYDRMPWPRPTILHKARRLHFGKGYDDMLTRFKLKQAYGRLIRTPTDKGIFVMLDSRLPTRLTTAFPPDVTIERIGLAEAVKKIEAFF